MTIEQQNTFMNLINDDFELMKSSLDDIKEKIAIYPVMTQISFYKPIMNMIFEALVDSNNEKDDFLNNFIKLDNIKI